MGISVLSSADSAWFVPVHQLCSILKKMVFKVIWLFVTGFREGLVTDVVISCFVSWETVMQSRNYDDSVVCLEEK